MADQWRDPFAPFSEEEFETLRTEIYPSLPTFRKEDWSIGSEDIEETYRKLRWPRTPEQIAAYQRYTIHDLGGRVTFDAAKGLMSVVHEGIPWFRHYLTISDINKDGFLERCDFQRHIDTFKAHYPTWSKTADE